MIKQGTPFLDWMSRFPGWLRANRTRSKLTQAQLADRLKVSRSYVTLLEQGRRAPKVAFCKKLILYFRRLKGKKRPCR